MFVDVTVGDTQHLSARYWAQRPHAQLRPATFGERERERESVCVCVKYLCMCVQCIYVYARVCVMYLCIRLHEQLSPATCGSAAIGKKPGK